MIRQTGLIDTTRHQLGSVDGMLDMPLSKDHEQDQVHGHRHDRKLRRLFGLSLTVTTTVPPPRNTRGMCGCGSWDRLSVRHVEKAEDATDHRRHHEDAYQREDPTHDPGEEDPVMLVHRVWRALLSYSYRARRLLGAPGERHGEPPVVHGERACAAEDEKSATEAGNRPHDVHVDMMRCRGHPGSRP
ncbi:hypothetical protein [Dactylosporangium darangshiense]|uniref:hypothetical protein n=1 Tax=Dactylosporangium darangshiense TaxID=579108 RepID=UPI0031EC04EA